MPRTVNLTPPLPEPLWTDVDVSEYLHGMSVRTLANWRWTGFGPPFIRIGKGRGAKVFYSPASVEAWAKQQEVNTTGAVA